MSDLVVSALRLTLLGMGMTFLSIGALVGGMFLLTRLTSRRSTASAGNDASAPDSRDMGVGERQQITVAGAESYGDTRPSGALETGTSEMQERTNDEEERRQAVAAAVAVALALSEGARSSSALTPSGPEPNGEPLWNVYVRGLHLSVRSRYESLRGQR
jgi:hypothetical protein